VPGTEVVALDDPLVQAERWVNEGADHLHIIDLDGAILGRRINAPILSQMVKKLDLFLQVGGASGRRMMRMRSWILAWTG